MWDAIWRYFRNTWMQSYGVDLWNVECMTAAGVNLQNRTNNPLESYNRAFGGRFSVKHPSLLSFVETVKDEARRFVHLIDGVKKNRRDPPRHAQFMDPRVPDEFER
ncbi:hypothetical protein PF008_g9824 [Phytophthora fragariae]|uniref:Uncharacterized protein n=1 Tax=Phytophthora fragariae TaxID=53985 RepID=A0A6G0RVM4_9STRA|nr:hypothetical protein PF008_g9824 [Phytophthora fragariae]